MFHLLAPLVLASQSPRRSDLLARLGMTFEVHPSNVDEDLSPGMIPGDAVEQLALRKAEHVATSYSEALVLGADTMVVLDGRTLGKPANPRDAVQMLRQLSGRTHTVYSGIALVHRPTARAHSAHERTEVTFGSLSGEEIDAYVSTGSPLDKAGAYGIQDDLGALFIDRINGDYYNVVGLPLRCLYRTLRSDFSDLLSPLGNRAESA
jgi:septum formation protein